MNSMDRVDGDEELSTTTACRLLVCGQIVGFSGQGSKIVRCTWHLQTDWNIRGTAGISEGATQASQPAHVGMTDLCTWGHPMELELECQQETEQGWPKLVLEVDEVQHAWGCAGGGRANALAYAVIPIPCSQGLHKIEVPCMRVYHRRSPCDISVWLGGVRPALASLEFAHNGEERAVLGHHTYAPIAAEAAGIVHLHLNVLVGGRPLQTRIADPSSPNPAERRAERLLAARLQHLAARDSPEQFTSGLDMNKSAYMKAAQDRLQGRQEEAATVSIPAGTAASMAMMAPASAALLQSPGSTLRRKGRARRQGSGLDNPSLSISQGIRTATSASAALDDAVTTTSRPVAAQEQIPSTSELVQA